MKLIIGLGNPGKEYDNTRHNIGFMVIDNYINSLNINVSWQNKFNALYTTINIKDEKVIFLKPQTYMNLSGNAVKSLINFYKIPLADIIVIHDDLDLPLGKYRIKTNSSAGGHNGIKSIIECLNTCQFARLKIGISNNKSIDTKDYVLGKFSQIEQKTIENLYPTFNNIINDFITSDISKIMNNYNNN